MSGDVAAKPGLASKLQKLQNRAARILTYSNYDANADNLIKKLGWIKLDSQRTIHKAVMVYKSLNGLTPSGELRNGSLYILEGVV